MKLDHMLSIIKSGIIFGIIVADLCVVKFQKRGLPHCHFLFWLHSNEKLHEPSQINKFILVDYLTHKKIH